MEYQIVYAQGSKFYEVVEELQKKVNDLIKKGWALQGGVTSSMTKYEWHYMSQAMVKMSARSEIRQL